MFKILTAVTLWTILYPSHIEPKPVYGFVNKHRALYWSHADCEEARERHRFPGTTCIETTPEVSFGDAAQAE